MKKYSSYKSIKPLNTTVSYGPKSPQTPTHSVSYRKLNTLELLNQRPPQKQEIYPMSTKFSTLSATNAGRKKMFFSKNIQQQTTIRPLTLTKTSNEDHSLSGGYKDIRTKINDLSNRLNEIKKNYDQSVQVRKCNEKDKNIKLMKQNDRSINTKPISSSKNKQNQLPKQKKTQSKLLLQRYQTNQKLKQGESTSTINLHEVGLQHGNNESRVQFDYGKPPLSPKNMTNFGNGAIQNNYDLNKKEQKRLYNGTSFGCIKINQDSNNDSRGRKTESENKIKTEGEKKLNLDKKTNFQQENPQPVSPKSESSYLKQFVTTFTCDNKLPLSHSTSQNNLFKLHNKLSQNPKSSENLYYVSAILGAFQSKTLTSFDNLCRNHMTTSLDILTYIKNCKKLPPLNCTRKALSPVRDNKHTIIFDLDETLIHCNQNLNIEHNVALPIKFPNGQTMKAGINIRPYARQCLIELSKHFELIVFTASHQCYGNVIVDYLDPKGELIAHRYFRDSCHKTEEGFYVKDLRVIDRELGKMLLIDNAAYSYCFQLENGIPIIPFYDNKADLELKNLIPYLKGFIGQKNVRSKNEGKMKLSEYTKFKDVKSLINNLYAYSTE